MRGELDIYFMSLCCVQWIIDILLPYRSMAVALAIPLGNEFIDDLKPIRKWKAIKEFDLLSPIKSYN